MNPAWKKGVSGNPEGRQKGSQNKATKQIKEHYTNLIQGNLDSIQGWLNETARSDPSKALDFLIKLSPFVIPKQVSQDITFDSPIKIVIPPKPESGQDDEEGSEEDPTDYLP